MKKCPGHIWLWEEDEYIALREALNKHDPLVSIAQMAIFLGTDEATISAYLTGRLSLDANFALMLEALTGILVKTYSPRLAQEISRFNGARPKRKKNATSFSRRQPPESYSL
ncbi:hypothetical protein ACIOVF_27555 [Pseudomonas sp. NPDC087612]|uniref:hypothetical protein n=1 Tax=Pseudomonas sp. NPDC087612 TaxID=3364441 RepID=UPI00380398E6